MGDITLGGNTVFLLILGLVIATIVTIIVLKTKFKNSGDGLTEKYKDHNWSSPLDSRNKYPDVNPFRFSGPVFLFGLSLIHI